MVISLSPFRFFSVDAYSAPGFTLHGPRRSVGYEDSILPVLLSSKTLEKIEASVAECKDVSQICVCQVFCIG
jgi:hypothetical protein